jgi:hypothetical protein
MDMLSATLVASDIIGRLRVTDDYEDALAFNGLFVNII